MRFIALLMTLLVTDELPASDSIRVATWNLNFANQRGDEVLSAIEASKPDVILFQETTRQSEGFLKQHLAKEYPYFYSAGHKGHYFAERFAFASRTELRNVKFAPPEAGLFGFYSADATIHGHSIRLINAHLAPIQLNGIGSIGEAMAAFSKLEEVHAKEIDAIISTIEKDQPTIIAGDFNSVSTFVAPTKLEELGFTDAFASVHDNPDSHPTWRWPSKPIPLAMRIDNIFHSRHFRTAKCRIVERHGSDHFLVVAELRVVKN